MLDSFTKAVSLKISRLPAYQHALQILQTHPDAVVLDIGCCCSYFALITFRVLIGVS